MPAYRWAGSEAAYVNLRTGERLSKFIVDVTEPTKENVGPQIPVTTPYTGTMNIASATVVRGMHITGRVVVQNAATGLVIIEHCIIDASSLAPSTSAVVSVQVNTGATVIIRYCEIIGQVGMIGISVRGFTAYRNYVHNVEDAVRLNNFAGTGQALNTELYANYLGPLISKVPDPNQTREDNRTHSDVIQIEGGDGANIHGNTLDAMNTTDGTSDVYNFKEVAPFVAVAPGTPNSRPHPQAMACLMVNPGVSAITNLIFRKNWCKGGAYPINAGGATAGTTGIIEENLFDRQAWYPSPTIGVASSATGLLTPASNRYEDDNSLVPVSRGW